MKTIFYFIVAISILVFVHELGHYLVARIFRVYIEKFSIGFGRALFSFKNKSGTLFSIGWIPLGGFVKMQQMPFSPIDRKIKEFGFLQIEIWKRALIIFAGPFFNFIFAFLLFWILFLPGIPTQNVIIKEIIPNSIVSKTNILPGDELKTISEVEVNNLQDIYLAFFENQQKNQLKIEYLSKNQSVLQTDFLDLHNFKIDFEQSNWLKSLGFVFEKTETLPILSEVLPDSPAIKSGLEKNDKILKVNQENWKNWDDFSQLIKNSAEKPIYLEVERNQQNIALTLKPGKKENSLGLIEGFAGIVPKTNVIIQKLNLFESFCLAGKETVKWIRVTIKSFLFLISGTLEIKNLSGPISLAKTANQSASYGFYAFLVFLTQISITLGVVNLFPLPILDGGHLLLLFFEKVKGKPLSSEAMIFFYKIGFFVLMLLMGLALFNDFYRWFV